MSTLVRRGLLGPLARIGRTAETTAQHAGQMASLAWRSAAATLGGRVSWRSVMDQFWEMGVRSLSLVLLTGVISGVVTTQQGGYQLTSTIPL